MSGDVSIKLLEENPENSSLTNFNETMVELTKEYKRNMSHEVLPSQSIKNPPEVGRRKNNFPEFV